MSDNPLDVEIELIESSLLPVEQLKRLDAIQDGPTQVFVITSKDSSLSLRFEIDPSGYPARDSAKIEVHGKDDGREEAEGWKRWVLERVGDWNEEDDYPLFQLLTNYFLPLLAPSTAPSSPQSIKEDLGFVKDEERPHHVLLTSHHLIAPSKRKDLNSLSSQLSLVGFAKTGHPGIIYAIGSRADLIEWLREVKSWQWLALRVRIAPEPVEEEETGGKGKESGARGGKGRGEWVEVEKIGEAVEWMRQRGREKLLTNLGMGVGPER